MKIGDLKVFISDNRAERCMNDFRSMEKEESDSFSKTKQRSESFRA